MPNISQDISPKAKIFEVPDLKSDQDAESPLSNEEFEAKLQEKVKFLEKQKIAFNQAKFVQNIQKNAIIKLPRARSFEDERGNRSANEYILSKVFNFQEKDKKLPQRIDDAVRT